MSEREARIGKNEALFRQVNERLNEVGESFALLTDGTTFVCECGDLSCTAPIRLSLGDYERIREQPLWFVTVPGHVLPDVETVVEHGPGYEIVEKHPGAGAEVAIDEDPRA